MKKQFSFKWERDRPYEYGYVAFKPEVQVTGAISPLGDRPVAEGIGVGRTSLERSIEAKLAEDLKFKFKGKFEKELLDTLEDVIRDPSGDAAERLSRALREVLSIGLEYDLGDQVALEIETSSTPFSFTVKWKVEDIVELPERAKFSATCEGKLAFGPSKKGWEALTRKVGREALEQFFRRAGPQLARLGAWLVSSGFLTASVIAVGAIGGTFLLIGVGAVATSNARRHGALRGISWWYVSAYSAKVFNQPRPSGWIPEHTIASSNRLKDLVIEMGELDAIRDARYTARTHFQDPDHATAPEDVILRRHRARLERGAGSTANARHYLELELRDKAETLLGLR